MELVDAPHSKCGTFGFVGSSPTAPTSLMRTYTRLPLRLIKGKGCWVWDEQNTKYLDAVAGIATCTLGHSDKALELSLRRQLKTLQHISNLYHIKEQEDLAEWLVDKSCADSVFFCNSGAEANEAAIKLARKYGHKKRGIKKPIILSAKSSFHGRTLAAVSATGQPKYHKDFDPLVEGFKFFPYNDINFIENIITNLEKSQPSISAIIIEPLQGEGGVNPGNRNFFLKLRELCNKHEILLILDEVQTGVGRCGTWWGYEKVGIEPDVFTVAKGLGGGHPIGALLVKENADFLEPGDHASTFGGNPFACRAALTVVKEIERRKILENVNARSSQLVNGLIDLHKAFPNNIKETRGWGLIQGIVLREETKITSYDIVNEAIKQKLLIVAAGPKVIRMVPPLIIKKNEVNILLERLYSTLKEFI